MHAGNKFLQDLKPWEVIKSDKELCGTYLAACMGLVALLAALVQPYMPSVTLKVCIHVSRTDKTCCYRQNCFAPWMGLAALVQPHKLSVTKKVCVYLFVYRHIVLS